MKNVLLCGILLSLVACSSVPKIEGFDKPRLISRNETIQYAKDCVNATIMLPVEVHCDVYK